MIDTIFQMHCVVRNINTDGASVCVGFGSRRLDHSGTRRVRLRMRADGLQQCKYRAPGHQSSQVHYADARFRGLRDGSHTAAGSTGRGYRASGCGRPPPPGVQNDAHMKRFGARWLPIGGPLLGSLLSPEEAQLGAGEFGLAFGPGPIDTVKQ